MMLLIYHTLQFDSRDCFYDCPKLVKATFIGNKENPSVSKFTQDDFSYGRSETVTVYRSGGGMLQAICTSVQYGLRFVDTSTPTTPEIPAVTSTSPTTFHPNGSITREQAATMLARFAKRAALKSTSSPSFADAPSFSSWATDGITFISGVVDPATGSAVMGGTSATVFSPKGTFTREQAITTTLRLANILGIK